jgi:hemolysin activation/secretion protein
MPLSLGWVAARPDKHGGFTFNYNQNFFLEPLASARKAFQAVAGSAKAGGNFTTIQSGFSRQQILPKDWSLLLRASGQWTSRPLIGNEQFALGGTSGVRGYQDGESYGDTGWRTSFDVRAPAYNIGFFPTENGDVSAKLRPSWFVDYGEVYGLATGLAIRQWGTGLGFYLTAGEHFEARLTLAWALRETAASAVGDTHAYFSVGYQF